MSSNKNTEASLSEVFESVHIPKTKNFWKKLFSFLGPAYLVAVGYMDPGNWATDLAGGSQFGYQLIWVLLLSNLMALLLQTLSARMGIVAKLDLAQASRKTYPKFVNFCLYILAELAIAACDLAEVIGMAIGLNLLFGIDLLTGVLITVLDTFLLLFLLNKGIRKMEAFILSLVLLIGISFVIELFIVEPKANELFKGFIPTQLSEEALYIAIGIIGATVMPHNLYLHSSLVQTRKIGNQKDDIKRAIKFNFIDSTIALNLAFFVNASILILAAAAFFSNGFGKVAEISDAHSLLNNLYGSWAPSLFALALIAAGQSSTLTGTLAGQIIMEGYLNLRIRPWLRRLLTRMLAIIPALITIYLFGDSGLGELLVFSQVILSLQLGFAVIPMIHFVSKNPKMGDYKIGKGLQVLAWISAIIIVGLNVKLVQSELMNFLNSQPNIWVSIILVILACLAGFLLLYITFSPLIKPFSTEKKIIPHGLALDLDKMSDETYYHKIAITIDFSKTDKLGISGALSQGKKNAQYLLIHIVESAGANMMGSESLDNEAQSDMENLLNYKNQLSSQGYSVDIKIGQGSPTKLIPEIVNEYQADLLVMGAHGHQGLKDIIFGETVDKVRHKINIPVLIVKDE